jgi:hypothetical protein
MIDTDTVKIAVLKTTKRNDIKLFQSIACAVIQLLPWIRTNGHGPILVRSMINRKDFYFHKGRDYACY